ncbi:hypothetical protein ACFQ0X_16490 [Streptomyces rectiviolaceus]|uniref:Uncharacterized protein n=1 Tax=Streptomyces rectiviolaceus TaxID=332591 RepID=A0ABP6ME57_9ACTN
MALQDDLTAVQRCVDDLVRAVGKLEQQVGAGSRGGLAGIDVRRVRTDADHLRESVALLRASAPDPAGAPSKRPDLVTIPDTPYDSSLWTDSDDEGLGARDRHAP